MIEIRELYKYYGDRRAIGPLSANIEKGGIVGLLGLNGAGKTTTLRVLACNLLPTSGSVRVDGVDVVERPEEVKQRIGYLPDVPPLYGEMRVREYLAFAGRLRGMRGPDLAKRIDEVAGMTEVGGVLDDLIASLSHGYRQRVGIAQAILHRPALVVLDEPISGLDPVQIVEMRDLVRSLGGEHTVVVSSHILSEIERDLRSHPGHPRRRNRRVRHRGRALRAAALGHARGREPAPRLARSRRGPERDHGCGRRAGGGGDRPDRARKGHRQLQRAGFGGRAGRALPHVAVAADFGILQLSRSEHELESVFLQLSAPVEGLKRAKRKRRRRAPKPGAEQPAAEEQP